MMETLEARYRAMVIDLLWLIAKGVCEPPAKEWFTGEMRDRVLAVHRELKAVADSYIPPHND